MLQLSKAALPVCHPPTPIDKFHLYQYVLVPIDQTGVNE